jgi:hypothetical protein
MADRKILNKYIDPNFNHEKLLKLRKPVEKQDNVRMMLPFSIRCDTCGNYLRIGTKINMRKETVIGETYLGIPIFRFYMKCCFCYSEMTMTTDPKNHDYLMEQGAVRLYESWKDARAAEEMLHEIRKNEEEGDTMKYIENKTYNSKREMDTLEAIDEIRLMKRDNARLSLESVVDALNKRDYHLDDEELKRYIDKVEELGSDRVATKEGADPVSAISLLTRNVLKKIKVSHPSVPQVKERPALASKSPDEARPSSPPTQNLFPSTESQVGSKTTEFLDDPEGNDYSLVDI